MIEVKPKSVTVQTSNTSKTIDWPLALQRTGGKEDLAIEMLAGLIDNLSQHQENINKALLEQDHGQLKSLIHKLNGACCYTGVPSLNSVCKELETQLKNDTPLDELEPEFLELFEQIALVLVQAPRTLTELNEKES